MSCNNYDNCSKTERNTLSHPMDQEALYANRIYDNQTGNRRCYESNPIDIVEGFGFKANDLVKNILKLVIIALIAYVIYALITDMQKKEISVNVPAQVGGYFSPLTIN